MPITGVPQRRHNGEYESLKIGLITQRIDAIRATAEKKRWTEDRLAHARLEDWLFTVRT